MARGNGSATNDAPTGEGQAATGEGSSSGSGRARPDRSYIVLPVPADLKTRFENEAKAADKSVGPYVRDLLAGFLGVEIPATVSTRRSKYTNDEERKAAQKARNQNRSSTMRDLMKAFREAQASGKSPEEAAQIAAQHIQQLLVQGPSTPAQQPAETAGAAA